MQRFPVGASATIEELEADPHPLLARLREREPVSWVPALGGWLVTRRDLALAAMRNPELFTVDDPRFSTGQVVGRSMLNTDGPEHERQRAPFAREFARERVLERFAGIVSSEFDRLVDGIAPLGRADLRSRVAGPLAAAVMTHALGLDDVGAERLLLWYRAIVAATSDLSAGRPLSQEGTRAAADLRAAIEERLTDLPGGLSAAEYSSNAAVVLFGGIETTEGMICNALVHLLAAESQLALVRAEPALLANAIEESLRLEPAAASVDRYATQDTELGGARIQKGDLLTVSLAGANRDPALFPDPDRFDVRRRNAGRHLSFAAGRHLCIGAHLARLEARIAVSGLLERLPDLRADPAASPAARGLVFRKPAELRVIWG